MKNKTLLVIILLTAIMVNSCRKEISVPESPAEVTAVKTTAKVLALKNAVDLAELRREFIKRDFSELALSSAKSIADDQILWDIQWSLKTVTSKFTSGKLYTYIPIVARLNSGRKLRAFQYQRYLLVINQNGNNSFYLAHASNAMIKDVPQAPAGSKFTGTLVLVSLEDRGISQFSFEQGVMKQVLAPTKKASGKSLMTEECIITYQCSYTYWCSSSAEMWVTYTQGTSCNNPPTWNPCSGSSLDEVAWNFSGSQEIGRFCFPENPPVDPPDPGDGGGEEEPIDLEDPGEENFELVVAHDSIKLSKRFRCFDNVPTNANTTYSIKICADLPVNGHPTRLINSSLDPGHAFIELTKTYGSTSVTQTIGFYPVENTVATLFGSVPSMMVDNAGAPYDASILKMLNASEFASVLDQAIVKSGNLYHLRNFNCTTFALDVFNHKGATVIIPNWTGLSGLNYGKTPNGLFLDIQSKYNNLYPGAAPFTGSGAASTNCN